MGTAGRSYNRSYRTYVGVPALMDESSSAGSTGLSAATGPNPRLIIRRAARGRPPGLSCSRILGAVATRRGCGHVHPGHHGPAHPLATSWTRVRTGESTDGTRLRRRRFSGRLPRGPHPLADFPVERPRAPLRERFSRVIRAHAPDHQGCDLVRRPRAPHHRARESAQRHHAPPHQGRDRVRRPLAPHHRARASGQRRRAPPHRARASG